MGNVGADGSLPVEVRVRPGTTLGQVLKLAGAVSTGGEAKMRIEAGEVVVNDEVERRRGRKLRENDSIRIAARSFLIRVACGAGESGTSGECS